MKVLTLSKPGVVALVDDDDYKEVSKHKWSFSWKGNKTLRYYARRMEWIPGVPNPKTGKHYQYRNRRGELCERKGHYKNIMLHRQIMNAPKGMDVDHIDGDGLNNQKSNLRICTRSENNMNAKLRYNSKSGLKGVSWDTRTAKWRVTITLNGKTEDFGRYADINDALAKRIEAEKKYFKNYARPI